MKIMELVQVKQSDQIYHKVMYLTQFYPVNEQ